MIDKNGKIGGKVSIIDLLILSKMSFLLQVGVQGQAATLRPLGVQRLLCFWGHQG